MMMMMMMMMIMMMMMMMMQNMMGPACGGLQFVNTIVTISESCIMCIVIKKKRLIVKTC